MAVFELSGANYSEIDASNNTASPAGMPEGMPPSGVNDAWRASMGSIKRSYDRDHATAATTVGGTGNAITLTYPAAPPAYVQGEKYAFKATAANSGATTITVNALGAKNVFKKGGAGAVACVGAEINIGDIVELEYDGTQFQILGAGGFSGGTLTSATSMSGAAINEAETGAIPSAATVDLSATAGNFVVISGVATITSFGTIAGGARRTIVATGAFTIAASGNIVMPAAASYTCASGDILTFRSEGSGIWVLESYNLALGGVMVPATKAQMQTGTNNTQTATAARVNDHDGVAKAWGSANIGASTLAASFNVASVLRNGAGDYTFTFTTSFTTGAYAATPSVAAPGGAAGLASVFIISKAAGSVRVGLANSGGTLTDPTGGTTVDVVCFGRQ